VLEEIGQAPQGGGQSLSMIIRGDVIRHVFGDHVDAGTFVDGSDFPRHRHCAGVGWVVRDELHCLYDPYPWNEINKAGFNDVGVSGGLASLGGGIVVGEHHSIRPTWP
jgi:hypothetical protein